MRSNALKKLLVLWAVLLCFVSVPAAVGQVPTAQAGQAPVAEPMPGVLLVAPATSIGKREQDLYFVATTNPGPPPTMSSTGHATVNSQENIYKIAADTGGTITICPTTPALTSTGTMSSATDRDPGPPPCHCQDLNHGEPFAEPPFIGGAIGRPT
jgi:hypothetical protein